MEELQHWLDVMTSIPDYILGGCFSVLAPFAGYNIYRNLYRLVVLRKMKSVGFALYCATAVLGLYAFVQILIGGLGNIGFEAYFFLIATAPSFAPPFLSKLPILKTVFVGWKLKRFYADYHCTVRSLYEGYFNEDHADSFLRAENEYLEALVNENSGPFHKLFLLLLVFSLIGEELSEFFITFFQNQSFLIEYIHSGGEYSQALIFLLFVALYLLLLLGVLFFFLVKFYAVCFPLLNSVQRFCLKHFLRVTVLSEASSGQHG